jgi:uroporphyrinogen III methyltransferase / synthase
MVYLRRFEQRPGGLERVLQDMMEKRMGKVYLVGAGPGDLKLITVRGFELLQTADTIIYDYLVNKDLLALAKPGAEIIYVGKQASRHELPQPDINTLLVEKARDKDIIVRLKGGDPFVFGRGGEEAEFLVENGASVEIVPGVTSAISAPAYAGIPLTHREHASTVAFITGHEDEKKSESTIRWKELANAVDTLVFLMGIKNLKEISSRLIKEGRDPKTPAAVIQWGTLPRQRVVTATLQDIDRVAKKAGMKPPGIILVGNVIKLREKLLWFENKPLFSKRIVVTRAPRQSTKLGALLADKGAQVLYTPTIDIAPIEPNHELARAIESISEYDYIIFTSVNGVSVFFDHLFRQRRDVRALHDIRILPIGPATASLLESKGIIPDLLPDTFTSEGIIEVLKTVTVKNERFLLPRAEEARDILVQYIREQDGTCDVIPVYRTTLPDPVTEFPEKPDVVTFTSSSTVNNFVTLYGRQTLRNTLVASIGPITSKTLRACGIPVDMEADRFDIAGLVDAIERHFGHRTEVFDPEIG